MKPPPTLPIREGEIVAGKYRIDSILGAGGMGVVVAAEHVQLRQRVAIKFLLPDAVSGTAAVARFMREAQAAARIQSEHVARVLDVGTLGDSVPYIVLEFLEGRDLAQVLAKHGPLQLEDAVGYVLQACEGVAEAHAAGIVHRDLKPSNLFVCDRGGGRNLVKVLDFGVSKSLPGSGPDGQLDLTKTHAALGSPLYMSPEQMSSAKHVDVRTDIWSLGVTLFELLCGAPPFDAESITELVSKVLRDEPFPIQERRPDLPPEFRAALARALEKDRSHRYQSIAELAAAIAPFGPRHSEVSVERISSVLSSSRALLPPLPGSGAGSSPRPPTPRPQAHAAWGDSTEGTTSKPRLGAGTTLNSSAWNVRALAAGVAVFFIAGVGGIVAVQRGAWPAKTQHGAISQGSVSPPSSVDSIATPSAKLPSEELAPRSGSSSAANAADSGPAGEHTLAAASAASTHHAPAKGPHGKAPAAHTATTGGPPPPDSADTSAGGAPAAHAPSASASPACHVVQYVDSEGDTRFKQVCP
jgi:serine/threonine-protein kinase